MIFVSTAVSPGHLAGNLTINGTTTINRSDFGIDFNAPLGLDGMLISNKVDIELEIQIVPQG